MLLLFHNAFEQLHRADEIILFLRGIIFLDGGEQPVMPRGTGGMNERARFWCERP
jgi:hypothetical protein